MRERAGGNGIPGACGCGGMCGGFVLAGMLLGRESRAATGQCMPHADEAAGACPPMEVTFVIRSPARIGFNGPTHACSWYESAQRGKQIAKAMAS